jgi:hypothetical protein
MFPRPAPTAASQKGMSGNPAGRPPRVGREPMVQRHQQWLDRIVSVPLRGTRNRVSDRGSLMYFFHDALVQ